MEVYTNNWTNRKYQIGYALSGGFIKGFAHLGVMQALLEHDIKPDIISGVSAGALAGVFYADGNEPHKVLDYFSGHKFQDLTKLVIPKKGLFDLCEFIDFLRTNVKAKNLEELQIPLIITATDLDHGRMVHFHRGSIAERVAASCCMPVMFLCISIQFIEVSNTQSQICIGKQLNGLCLGEAHEQSIDVLFNCAFLQQTSELVSSLCQTLIVQLSADDDTARI